MNHGGVCRAAPGFAGSANYFYIILEAPNSKHFISKSQCLKIANSQPELQEACLSNTAAGRHSEQCRTLYIQEPHTYTTVSLSQLSRGGISVL